MKNNKDYEEMYNKVIHMLFVEKEAALKNKTYAMLDYEVCDDKDAKYYRERYERCENEYMTILSLFMRATTIDMDFTD